MSSLSLLCLLVAIAGLNLAVGSRRYHHGYRGYYRGYAPYYYGYRGYGYPYYGYPNYGNRYGYNYLAQSEAPSCGRWMSWQKGENCAKVVERFGLKDEKELESLNIDLQCSSIADLTGNEQICVKTLKEGATSKSFFCEEFLVASAGETCDLIDKRFDVEWDISALNPELNCEKLIEGEILCGKMFVAPVCEVFHKVSKTDETCQSVVEKEKLRGLATLITLNPDLDCNKPMEVGRMLCLKIISNED